MELTYIEQSRKGHEVRPRTSTIIISVNNHRQEQPFKSVNRDLLEIIKTPVMEAFCVSARYDHDVMTRSGIADLASFWNEPGYSWHVNQPESLYCMTGTWSGIQEWLNDRSLRCQLSCVRQRKISVKCNFRCTYNISRTVRDHGFCLWEPSFQMETSSCLAVDVNIWTVRKK